MGCTGCKQKKETVDKVFKRSDRNAKLMIVLVIAVIFACVYGVYKLATNWAI